MTSELRLCQGSADMLPAAAREAERQRALLAAFPAAELPHLALRGVLGEGGMSTVYEAMHERLDLPVAVKLLHVPDARADEARARMLREARLYATLGDPRVPRVFDVDVLEDGRVYVVLERVHGTPLEVFLEAGTPLAPELAVRVASELLDSLVSLHAAGILHRDIKPANILLDSECAPAKVWLIDLGIAKEEGRRTGQPPLTLQGVVLGTPHYMSPERIVGGEADARADVYSVGVLLYEMLTGAQAFAGSTEAQVVASVLRDALPDVRAHVPGLSSALAGLVGRAVSRDASRRFPTAAAMLRALRGVPEAELLGAASALRPVACVARAPVRTPVLLSEPPEPARGVRERGERGKVLICVAVGLAIAMGISWWRDDGETKARARTAPSAEARRAAEASRPSAHPNPLPEPAMSAHPRAATPQATAPARSEARAESGSAQRPRPAASSPAAARPAAAQRPRVEPRPDVQSLAPPSSRSVVGGASAFEERALLRRIRMNPYLDPGKNPYR
jgi:hypothetical protein